MPDPASRAEPVRVIGHRWSPQVHEIKDFLARSRVAYRWLDVERDPRAMREAEASEAGGERLPVVIFPDGSALSAPGVREVAEKIGLDTRPDSPFYDLIVIGGGPAGLAAAVYGASEGLRTVVLERGAPGGQAAQSTSIENYLGFPDGVSGADLARRAIRQAERFGAEVLATRAASAVRADDRLLVVTLDDGSELASHALLIATGVTQRWLDAPGCPALVGAGIYYGAAAAEASAMRGQDAFLLGGGNSAGQAALHLADFARRVIMIVLERTLDQTMSRYLVERIRERENIEVRTNSTVAQAEGQGHLEFITIRHAEMGEEERVRAHGLFVFIGGVPQTDWLAGVVDLDDDGFILAGPDLVRDGRRPSGWPHERDPLLLETSTPGVFVAGDVRHGAVKRISTAVGDGGMAIQLVHQYCSER